MSTSSADYAKCHRKHCSNAIACGQGYSFGRYCSLQCELADERQQRRKLDVVRQQNAYLEQKCTCGCMDD